MYIFSCKETALGGFPIWIIILGFVSHILLVLNSMANLLIYCLVGTKFRKAFVKVFVLIANLYDVVVDDNTILSRARWWGATKPQISAVVSP